MEKIQDMSTIDQIIKACDLYMCPVEDTKRSYKDRFLSCVRTFLNRIAYCYHHSSFSLKEVKIEVVTDKNLFDKFYKLVMDVKNKATVQENNPKIIKLYTRLEMTLERYYKYQLFEEMGRVICKQMYPENPVVGKPPVEGQGQQPQQNPTPSFGDRVEESSPPSYPRDPLGLTLPSLEPLVTVGNPAPVDSQPSSEGQPTAAASQPLSKTPNTADSTHASPVPQEFLPEADVDQKETPHPSIQGTPVSTNPQPLFANGESRTSSPKDEELSTYDQPTNEGHNSQNQTPQYPTHASPSPQLPPPCASHVTTAKPSREPTPVKSESSKDEQSKDMAEPQKETPVNPEARAASPTKTTTQQITDTNTPQPKTEPTPVKQAPAAEPSSPQSGKTPGHKGRKGNRVYDINELTRLQKTGQIGTIFPSPKS